MGNCRRSKGPGERASGQRREPYWIEPNRRGNAGDRPLSALSVDEFKAELKAGEKAG